ncbi:hypothetical protein ACFVJR_11645 [Nocardia salmonicida]
MTHSGVVPPVFEQTRDSGVRRAAELFEEHTATFDGGPYTLHQRAIPA